MVYTTSMEVDEHALRRWYEDDLRTDEEIGKVLGVHKSRVAKLRAQWGIQTIRKSERKARKAGFKGSMKDILIEMYVSRQMSTTEISEVLGVGTTTVTRLRREFGIETRPASISLVGRTFGRWRVVREIRGGRRGVPTRCLCECSCGTISEIPRGNLLQGLSRSCGCLRSEQNRLAWGEAIHRSVLSEYRRVASRRGLLWTIRTTDASRLLKEPCFYCGVKPYRTRSHPQSRLYGDFTYNGIDRVDNRKGYITGNVVACCPECNYAKHTMPVEDFLSHVMLITGRAAYTHREIEQPAREAIYPCSGYKSGASRRGLNFTLTYGQVYAMMMAPCVYCGTVGSNHCKDFRYNGIDRVDSAKGYTPENTVPCCGVCNRMKNARDVDDFLGWARRLQHHQRSISMR